MKLTRRSVLGACLAALAVGIPASMAGCSGEVDTKEPAKRDDQATQEHNDKMKEYMQSKGGKKK
jgi:hypothetical protein